MIIIIITQLTNYMVISRDQEAGRSHSIKTDNGSIESVEVFKHMGTNLNQNCIHLLHLPRRATRVAETCSRNTVFVIYDTVIHLYIGRKRKYG